MDIRLTSRQNSEQIDDVEHLSLEAVKSDEYEDFGEHFGILRVISSRENVENLSDEYILDKDVVTLGRASRTSGSDVQIDDAFLSSEHVKLTFDGESWYAEDLNSRNGTFVNGEAIDACKLLNGDSIAIGSVIFELEV